MAEVGTAEGRLSFRPLAHSWDLPLARPGNAGFTIAAKSLAATPMAEVGTAEWTARTATACLSKRTASTVAPVPNILGRINPITDMSGQMQIVKDHGHIDGVVSCWC